MDATVMLGIAVGVLSLVTLGVGVLLVTLVRGQAVGRNQAQAPARAASRPERKARHGQRPAPPVATAAPVADPDDEFRSRRQAADRRDELLAEREDRLNRNLNELHNRESHLDQVAEGHDKREALLTEAEAERVRALADVAGLSPEDARAELMTHVEKDARLHAAQLTREIESEAKLTADARARAIIVTSIQRMAAEQTTESVVAAVPLPGDEMKGRIIGREGRNIRAFEQITGVNVLIDDTPESVLLSCFDPVRREIARLTLTELVADGRIHPARIEEVHERSQRRVQELCIRAAEDALIEMGITDLAPGLLPVLGALQYRTSYGQNVLKHLIECGHIAAMLAGELGLDIELCRRAAFLHDIGKAMTHEAEGSHAKVGADLARRHGEHPDIVHAIEAHHNEVEPRTVEAVLTQAADAISGSRPGARRESLEMYVKRLQRLEDIAMEHEGVDKVFAMQAGREIRVMVVPELVNDAQSAVIAREIAKRVEEELTYPGNIKVTVVRESRAIALAK